MRTTWFSVAGTACAKAVATSLLHVVVRRLFRDRHVVRVALLRARRRDAHELRALAQLLERRGAHVAHAGAHAADELAHERRQRPLRGDHALDALGHELVAIGHVALAVALLAAL